MSTDEREINHAAGFSRNVDSAREQPKISCLYQSSNPISGQSDSRDGAIVKKKRELFPEPSQLSPVLLVLPLNILFPVQEY
ncbi:MAG: hypothetical protein E4H07_04820 [Nitrosomonadales bacterium]|jgi:hypothetical protein|nr:MAG: hypothetical protein E4H07_04820 [Nitrosomonadales bacterium]